MFVYKNPLLEQFLKLISGRYLIHHLHHLVILENTPIIEIFKIITLLLFFNTLKIIFQE